MKDNMVTYGRSTTSKKEESFENSSFNRNEDEEKKRGCLITRFLVLIERSIGRYLELINVLKNLTRDLYFR